MNLSSPKHDPEPLEDAHQTHGAGLATERHNFPLTLPDFDPRAVIDDVVETLEGAAQGRHLFLASLVYDSVPPRLRGDPGALRQILLCLVSNAIRFSERGQINISLTRDSASPSPISAVLKMRFAVSDTGSGIAHEAQQQLFQRSARTDSVISGGRDEAGSGLSHARELVEQMGGSIGVESAPGQGATFWFTAQFDSPLEIAQAGLMPQQQSFVEEMTPDGKRAVRVLVAEDDPANQQAMLLHLTELGYYADVVANGEEALDAAAKTPYDIILMDCQMPYMDGYLATKAIRSRESGSAHTVIIALTAQVSESNRTKCLAVGMDDYLGKPVERNILAERLRYWLRSRSTTGSIDSVEDTEPAWSAKEQQSGAVVAHPGRRGAQISTAEQIEGSVQLIRLYLRDAPSRMEAMRVALAGQDARALERAAHALKSSSGLLGATRVAALCEGLENWGESGQVRGAEDALRQLEEEFVNARRILEGKIKRETGSREAD